MQATESCWWSLSQLSYLMIGERIREVGHEYGTTTGRPRRVGWFDSVVIYTITVVYQVSQIST